MAEELKKDAEPLLSNEPIPVPHNSLQVQNLPLLLWPSPSPHHLLSSAYQQENSRSMPEIFMEWQNTRHSKLPKLWEGAELFLAKKTIRGLAPSECISSSWSTSHYGNTEKPLSMAVSPYALTLCSPLPTPILEMPAGETCWRVETSNSISQPRDLKPETIRISNSQAAKGHNI